MQTFRAWGYVSSLDGFFQISSRTYKLCNANSTVCDAIFREEAEAVFRMPALTDGFAGRVIWDEVSTIRVSERSISPSASRIHLLTQVVLTRWAAPSRLALP